MGISYREEILERAKQVFPATNNIRMTGYILPDGTMLDFSAGQGSRVMDHREVSDAYVNDDGSEYLFDTGDLSSMEHFVKETGAIRFGPEGYPNDIFLDFENPLTESQMRVLGKIFRDVNSVYGEYKGIPFDLEMPTIRKLLEVIQ